MRKPHIAALSLAVFLSACAHDDREKPLQYATADVPTPVFYTAELRSVFGNGALEDMSNIPSFEDHGEGNRLHLDPWGEIDELEFIALPGTVFLIHETRDGIHRVTTSEYPGCATSDRGCYIDARFVTLSEAQPQERERILPAKEDILNALMAAEGADYVWGGNAVEGVPELLQWYPPQNPVLPQSLQDQWALEGVDCSGLLYEATNGYTPRNTSDLVTYGEGIDIAGLNAAEIAQKLRPLDIIVWKGHNLIVLDKTTLIESIVDFTTDTDAIENGGVRIVNAEERLTEILQSRVPVNDYDDELPSEGMKKLVVRRWYSD